MPHLLTPRQIAAVRLHHPTLRNTVFTVERQDVIYPHPYPCPGCKELHIFKTFHLNLNENGNVTVTPEIYDLFKAQGIDKAFSVVNEATPAPTILRMDDEWQPDFIVSREHGIIRMEGHNREVSNG